MTEGFQRRRNDVLTKTIGSTNPVNVVRAALKALEELESVESVAQRRGKPVSYFGRRRNKELAEEAANAARRDRIGAEIMAENEAAVLRVTYLKSAIGYAHDQKATVRALGLRRLHQTVELPDNPSVRGMCFKVRHLVSVDEAGAGDRRSNATMQQHDLKPLRGRAPRAQARRARHLGGAGQDRR